MSTTSTTPLALRCRVFVLEQGPYLDPDGIDRQAWHLLGPRRSRHAAGLPAHRRPRRQICRAVDRPRHHLAREARHAASAALLMAEGVARCLAAVARRRHPHQRAVAPGALLRRLGFAASATNISKTTSRISEMLEEPVMHATHEVTNQSTPLRRRQPVPRQPAVARRSALARARTRPRALRRAGRRGRPAALQAPRPPGQCPPAGSCTRTTATAAASTRSSSTPATTRCWAARCATACTARPGRAGRAAMSSAPRPSCSSPRPSLRCCAPCR